MEGVLRPRSAVALVVTLMYSLLLVLVGYRLVVDATAAIQYNADERIPEAKDGAWVYAGLWGLLNGVVGWCAYRAGILSPWWRLPRVLATWLLVLDFSFLVVLELRGGVGDDAVYLIALAAVAGGLGFLAWRRPGLGGSLLMVIGAFLALLALAGSATYEGEAKGLLFDEDLFAVFSPESCPSCRDSRSGLERFRPQLGVGTTLTSGALVVQLVPSSRSSSRCRSAFRPHQGGETDEHERPDDHESEEDDEALHRQDLDHVVERTVEAGRRCRCGRRAVGDEGQLIVAVRASAACPARSPRSAASSVRRQCAEPRARRASHSRASRPRDVP